MEIWQAVIIGIVQGVSTFVPVSAVAHLLLVREVLTVGASNLLAFEAIFYAVMAIVVCLFFGRELWRLIQTLVRKLGRLPVNEKEITRLQGLVIGALPFLGLVFLVAPLAQYFETAKIVATVLIGSALFSMYAEWKYFRSPQPGELSVSTGLIVGLFQLLSLIPGWSRTGATIAGGMTLGLSRVEATRVSFLIALPVFVILSIKKSLELITLGVGDVDFVGILIGIGISTLVAFIVLYWFVRYMERGTLWPFIWYNLVIATLLLYTVYFL